MIFLTGFSSLHINTIPIIIIIPPKTDVRGGISLNMNNPITDAKIGSSNLAVETKAAFSYFNPQEKML